MTPSIFIAVLRNTIEDLSSCREMVHYGSGDVRDEPDQGADQALWIIRELTKGPLLADADQIICEEWQVATAKYNLRPGSPIEFVIGRILNRVRGLPPIPYPGE